MSNPQQVERRKISLRYKLYTCRSIVRSMHFKAIEHTPSIPPTPTHVSSFTTHTIFSFLCQLTIHHNHTTSLVSTYVRNIPKLHKLSFRLTDGKVKRQFFSFFFLWKQSIYSSFWKFFWNWSNPLEAMVNLFQFPSCCDRPFFHYRLSLHACVSTSTCAIMLCSQKMSDYRYVRFWWFGLLYFWCSWLQLGRKRVRPSFFILLAKICIQDITT